MHRNNSFDLARHLAALMVLISHHFILYGMKEPVFPGFKAYGTVAVIVFFSISGYLITKSMLRSESLFDYLKKRFLRLFPGLIVCAFLMSFVLPFLWAIFGGHSIHWPSIIGSFLKVISMIPYQQPSEMTADYIYPNTINGSLWTLPIEFLCYLFIACLIPFENKKIAITILFVLSILSSIAIYINNVNHSFYSISFKYAAPMIASFMIGAVISQSRSFHESKNLKVIILVSLFVLASASISKDFYLTAFFIMPVVILSVSLAIKDKLICGRFDYSYGIYIYAFPVQQIVINEFKFGFSLSLLLSILITLIFASASWHLVEERFLKKRNLSVNDGKSL